MPELNQLTCSVEIGSSKSRLSEYGTTYGNKRVQTFVCPPRDSAKVSIHLTSNGYIAPGLAMFVFIDGQYHCNRNKSGLVMPKENTPADAYEIDFRVRQKEEREGDGYFIGREWKFAQLETGSFDDMTNANEEFYKNVGTIEVIVLRLKTSGYSDGPGSAIDSGEHAEMMPSQILRSTCNEFDAGKAGSQKPSQSRAKGASAGMNVVSGAVSRRIPSVSAKAWSGPPSNSNLGQEGSTGGMMGMAGLFDGAADLGLDGAGDHRDSGEWIDHGDAQKRKSTASRYRGKEAAEPAVSDSHALGSRIQTLHSNPPSIIGGQCDGGSWDGVSNDFGLGQYANGFPHGNSKQIKDAFKAQGITVTSSEGSRNDDTYKQHRRRGTARAQLSGWEPPHDDEKLNAAKELIRRAGYSIRASSRGSKSDASGPGNRRERQRHKQNGPWDWRGSDNVLPETACWGNNEGAAWSENGGNSKQNAPLPDFYDRLRNKKGRSVDHHDEAKAWRVGSQKQGWSTVSENRTHRRSRSHQSIDWGQARGHASHGDWNSGSMKPWNDDDKSAGQRQDQSAVARSDAWKKHDAPVENAWNNTDVNDQPKCDDPWGNTDDVPAADEAPNLNAWNTPQDNDKPAFSGWGHKQGAENAEADGQAALVGEKNNWNASEKKSQNAANASWDFKADSKSKSKCSHHGHSSKHDSGFRSVVAGIDFNDWDANKNGKSKKSVSRDIAWDQVQVAQASSKGRPRSKIGTQTESTLTKSYWARWDEGHKGYGGSPSAESMMNATNVNGAQRVNGHHNPYIFKAYEPPTISIETAEKRNVQMLVRTGEGAKYYHRTSKVAYLDDFETPYAVFSFKYRSKEALKKIFRGSIEETKEKGKEASLRSVTREMELNPTNRNVDRTASATMMKETQRKYKPKDRSDKARSSAQPVVSVHDAVMNWNDGDKEKVAETVTKSHGGRNTDRRGSYWSYEYQTCTQAPAGKTDKQGAICW